MRIQFTTALFSNYAGINTSLNMKIRLTFIELNLTLIRLGFFGIWRSCDLGGGGGGVN